MKLMLFALVMFGAVLIHCNSEDVVEAPTVESVPVVHTLSAPSGGTCTLVFESNSYYTITCNPK